MATEIRSLHLPILQINNLFRPDKLLTGKTSVTKRWTPPSPTSPRQSYTNTIQAETTRPASPVVVRPSTTIKRRHPNPNLVRPVPYISFYIFPAVLDASSSEIAGPEQAYAGAITNYPLFAIDT